MYNAKIGRWNMADPLIEVSHNLSNYAFNNNNPIRYIDLEGRLSCEGGVTDPTKLYGKQIDMTYAPARGYNATGYPRNGPWLETNA